MNLKTTKYDDLSHLFLLQLDTKLFKIDSICIFPSTIALNHL